MIVTCILAVSRNGVVGVETSETIHGVRRTRYALPWRLPGDLGFFKRTTLDHTLIVGRKTWETIRHLPGRRFICLTDNAELRATPYPGTDFASSFEHALEIARSSLEPEVFVAGGAMVFEYAFQHAARLIVTHVEADIEAKPGERLITCTLPRLSRFMAIDRQPDVLHGLNDQYPFHIREYRRL